MYLFYGNRLPAVPELWGLLAVSIGETGCCSWRSA
jgi:hypothetical protein